MTNSDLVAIVTTVHGRIDPDEVGRQALTNTVAAPKSRVYDAPVDPPVDADALQVGSIARGTWFSSDRDINLFTCFLVGLNREEFKTYGLEIDHAVLPGGHERYAEHPYMKGDYNGFGANLVPCYDVPSTSDIRSVVDRTPFRNTYLIGRLDDDLAADVHVFKHFLKGIDTYGNDLRIEGFPGYLAGLLIAGHGGFEPLLRVAADRSPQIESNPEDHGARQLSDPLTVVDPTDPKWNVAAVCSVEDVARLQHYARDPPPDPRESLFFRPDPPALDTGGARNHLNRCGTMTVAVVSDCPDLMGNQSYLQLRKSPTGVADSLNRRGFDVFRRAALADTDNKGRGEAALLTEFSMTEYPAIGRHERPPVHVHQRAEGFYDTYENREDHCGPFLDGDRYAVEHEREFTAAAGFLESDALFGVALEEHVESTLRENGYDILVGGDVVAFVEAFGAKLGRYFAPRP